ncbi:MAG: fused MFS/spermidine synthase [Myxococcales bacterium]|nr:fused MFS/spermidine synthase [Myxococcales bacterium]
MTWILCLVFFFSGASALVFETLWFHQAGLAFGSSVWASSLVLAGFMAGMALGNALAARFGERVANPIRAYAVFELAIAATGVALVYGLPHVGPWLAASLGSVTEPAWLLNLLRLGLAFALLLVPSTAMGATLPLLTRALCAREPNFGRVLGRLYGWNTLGAVAGVLAAEAWLVGALGIRGTALAAGGVNAAAGIAAFALSRSFASATPPIPAYPARYRGAGRWLAAAFLSGSILLALEIVWFRLLSLFVLEVSLSLATMLAIVLAGIALGGFAASFWLRGGQAQRHAGALAFGAGLLCIGTYAASPWFLHQTERTLVNDPWGILSMGLPLMFPVSFVSGMLFTLLGAAAREEIDSATGASGATTFANTVGAAIGALLGGFVLLPALGMEQSIFALALTYGVVGLLALGAGQGQRIVASGLGVALALATLLFPFGTLETRHLQLAIDRYDTGGKNEVALVRESVTGTVVYLDRQAFGGRHLSHRLLTNGYSMSATSNRNRRYMQLYVYWAAALHPGLRDALLISYGVGSTAKALTQTRELEHIDVVDISSAILEANEVVYPDPAEHPLRDSRVDVHVEDGRYFLETTERRFDLITGEPPPPRMAGVVNLYTREYFELVRSRLRDGGMATYWLPIHSLTEVSSKAILRSFCEAFSDCSLWHGNGYDLMMVGTRNAAAPPSVERFTAQWRDPIVGAEMAELGFERPEQLGALFIGDAGYLRALTADTLPVTDDRPRRILAETRHPGGVPPEYAQWMNTVDARERFASSDWLDEIWPPEMREASLPYFQYQAIANVTSFAGSFTDLDVGIEHLDDVLAQTDLRTPVLWLLNSDADIQRAAHQVREPESAHAAVQHQLGIARLSERRYAEAAVAFARAGSHPHDATRKQAFRLRVYALCLAGRCAEGEEIARARYASSERRELAPFWSWMHGRFQLDPRAPELAHSR